MSHERDDLRSGKKQAARVFRAGCGRILPTISRGRWLRILQLDATADKSAIKRAYFELVKTVHPDVAGAASAPRFAELTEAYERLTSSSGEEGDDKSPKPTSPAMQARWNIRRKHKPSEYPAWFTPPEET